MPKLYKGSTNKSKTEKCSTSSGYESMLRDSDPTASSSQHDSTSESSSGGRIRGTKILKKRASESICTFCKKTLSFPEHHFGIVTVMNFLNKKKKENVNFIN